MLLLRSCIESFERFLRVKERTCPLCRKANYKKTCTNSGAKAYKNCAIIKVESISHPQNLLSWQSGKVPENVFFQLSCFRRSKLKYADFSLESTTFSYYGPTTPKVCYMVFSVKPPLKIIERSLFLFINMTFQFYFKATRYICTWVRHPSFFAFVYPS